MVVCAAHDATMLTWTRKPAATTSVPKTPPAARAAASTVSGLPGTQPPAVPPSPSSSARPGGPTGEKAKRTNEIRATVSSYMSDTGHNATATDFLSSSAALDYLKTVAEADKLSVREKLRQCFYYHTNPPSKEAVRARNERSRTQRSRTRAAAAASKPFLAAEAADSWAGGQAVCHTLRKLNSVHAVAMDPAAVIRSELAADAQSVFGTMGRG